MTLLTPARDIFIEVGSGSKISTKKLRDDTVDCFFTKGKCADREHLYRVDGILAKKDPATAVDQFLAFLNSL